VRDVLEIVVRLGETTLEHRFVPLGTPIEGLDPGVEWTRVHRGLVEISARRTAAPRKHALASSIGDRRSLGYVAVSLAAHLLLWGVATEEPPEITVRVEPQQPIGAHVTKLAATEAPSPWEIGDSPDYDLDGGGQPTMGLEGKAGGDVAKETGHARLEKGPVHAVTTKQEAIEQARTAGILGSTAAIASSVGHLTSTADFNAGFDKLDVQGPLYGGIGEGRGNFGLGRRGFGDSAGCGGTNCDGVIGVGRYGTISNGKGVGDHWGGHSAGAGGGWPAQGLRRRESGLRVFPCAGPSPCVISGGGLDKAVVRRYIRRELSKVQYCYEKELLASADLSGTVETQFLIQIDGRVSTISTSGVSPAVSSCVAEVIKNIEFPAQRAGIPDQRAITDVRYPFAFRTAGS
jgi:hypothetical protein